MSEQVSLTVPVQVTLFEDRAEVLRSARAFAPAGVSTVLLGGVSALVDDPSVVARAAQAEVRVLGTKVERRVREVCALSAGDLLQAEADHRAARRRREEAEQALSRAQGRKGRAEEIFESWIRAVGRVPKRGAKEGVRDAYGALDEELRGALSEVAALEQALLVAREDEGRAALRIKEGRRLQPRHETVIAVQLEARARGEVQIELSYRTPCALWRPEHVAKLVPREDGGHEIHWQILGTAWQQTGEDWRGVALRFSTARPGKAASPPLLSDDVLFARKKSEAERRTVVVEAREQQIALSGLGRGSRAVEEMPGVEDGGEPLCFTAKDPATIPGDGQPFRVELLALSLPCQVDLVAFPERTEAVHLRATATWSALVPILAGPVRLLRKDEVIGSGRVAFVPRGEPFEIGFGVDDGLRVRRQLETQRDTGLLGTQKVAVTVRLFLRNLSGAPRRLTVTERVPVSEIEDLKVALVQHQGGQVDERDGFVRFDVELLAGGERELTLAYRIEASAKVQLPY